MSCKFLHIRLIDSDNKIQPHDGLTVAYTTVDSPSVSGICFNVAKCHPDDRFEYQVGRQEAAKKLNEQGPLEVLPLTHPISEAIVDWIANTYWPSRRKYGGFSIDVQRDKKFRWLSQFTPSQQYVECY